MSTLVLLACASVAHAQDPARNPKLDVAFVGTAGSERTADFVAFLERQFGKVHFVDRTQCTPADFAKADVVLLDWDQQQGVIEWMNDRKKVPVCPLGARKDWDKPTVLLGSAGLNVSAVWGTCGSYG
jgi:hypothetical protein